MIIQAVGIGCLFMSAKVPSNTAGVTLQLQRGLIFSFFGTLLFTAFEYFNDIPMYFAKYGIDQAAGKSYITVQ